jgi:NAD(P)-dependent dehydrogenase (short-subunit alcohol dehydrogenase family)
MSARLQGKVCIVTGAGQGVGRGVALAFAREGATVAVVEFNEESGQQVAAEIEALGCDGLFVKCDVADRASVNAAAAAVADAFGGIDVLVNNAQRAPAGPTPLMDHTDEIVDLCFATGFRGTLHFMQACYPHLKLRGGRIINFASAAGLEGLAGMGAYGASKEAIRALSKTAAREWGPEGINVNIICPLAKSPGVVKLLELAPEMEQRMTAGNPIARIGECERDIAPVAVFLASDDARYVTGQTLCADGGGTMIR